MKGVPGIITEEGKYVEQQVVTCYQTDALMKLKPAAFMDIAQEIGFRAANVMGFGWDSLLPEGLAWVLTHMHFRYQGKVAWRDEISVSTWSRGPSGPFYLRDFRLEGENGSVIATSAWVLLNRQSRTICRHTEVLENIPPKYQCSEAVLPGPMERIQLPGDVEHEFVGEHTVGYSDIDIIGHTNNARYMVWAMECMDFNTVENNCPKDVYINFIHETKAGDKVALYRVTRDSSVFVEGKKDGAAVFTVRIDF